MLYFENERKSLLKNVWFYNLKVILDEWGQQGSQKVTEE